MKRIYFFLLTICFIGISCEKGQPIVEEFPRTITPTVIAQGELYGDSSGNIPEQNLVIKTQTEWTDLIAAIHLENSSLTNIDFSQHQLIAVFGEVHGNGGWNIDITKIVEDSNSIVVSYTNIETGNLVDTSAQPFQIVTIPVSDKNIVFPDSGNVVYRSCCDEERGLSRLNEVFPNREAYLFEDSIPEQMKYLDSYSQPGLRYWIIFDSKTNSACLTIKDRALRWYCEICNFPDFVKEWDIPQNGCEVYYDGRIYHSCIEKGGISMISHLDYVLTSLKRK